MRYYEQDHAVDDLVYIFFEEGYTEKTITEHRRNKCFLNTERYTISDEELLKQLCGLK